MSNNSAQEIAIKAVDDALPQNVIDELIRTYFTDYWDRRDFWRASLQHFYETGKASGSFRDSITKMIKQAAFLAAAAVPDKLPQKLGKGFNEEWIEEETTKIIDDYFRERKDKISIREIVKTAFAAALSPTPNLGDNSEIVGEQTAGEIMDLLKGVREKTMTIEYADHLLRHNYTRNAVQPQAAGEPESICECGHASSYHVLWHDELEKCNQCSCRFFKEQSKQAAGEKEQWKQIVERLWEKHSRSSVAHGSFMYEFDFEQALEDFASLQPHTPAPQDEIEYISLFCGSCHKETLHFEVPDGEKCNVCGRVNRAIKRMPPQEAHYRTEYNDGEIIHGTEYGVAQPKDKNQTQ